MHTVGSKCSAFIHAIKPIYDDLIRPCNTHLTIGKTWITYLINILLIRNNLIGGGGVKKEFQHSPQNQSISRFDNFSSYLMINTNEPKSTYVSDSFTNRSINDSMIDNFSPGDERRKFFRKYFIFHVDFIFSFSGAWAFKRLLG